MRISQQIKPFFPEPRLLVLIMTILLQNLIARILINARLINDVIPCSDLCQERLVNQKCQQQYLVGEDAPEGAHVSGKACWS